MLTTTQFLTDADTQKFAAVLKLYPNALKIKASLKKKQGESLEKLDKWYQDELGRDAQSRKPPYITRDELVRLMGWKLSRGKFRPRLMELAGSNSDESVQKASQQGIHLAQKDKIQDAIKALVVLKGIGPATASGILAACVPEKCCFFADEVAHAIPSLASLKYNAAEYEVLNSEMINCAKRLNCEAQKEDEKENGLEKWTPHKVELTIWTYSLLHQNNSELLSDISGKRRTSDKEEHLLKKQKK
ncbi:uncharacterized protein LOC121857152 [Homarus americanus]|uniref:Uncharacterized protein n=1 Tax=Homarus americanus TaxID=6706 RepID=A0A8J5JDD4_HOMAM|nr:uncharacterized protein LOC121857152 [Homarus americanus]KAG7153700.1 hypothetical protein Hamer_G009367 [Homarus americanus]